MPVVDEPPDRLPACHRCGAVRPGGGAARLAWSVEHDCGGRVRVLCPDCARRHARDIEARLPDAWW